MVTATPPPPSPPPSTAPDDGPPAIPAATVILVRDGANGLEVLALRRDSKLSFAGGMWVFPGGRIDPEDEDPAAPGDVGRAARRAAVREAAEEAGLVVDHESLLWFSHWTPPPISPKRFATWFFLAPAPTGDVVVDDGEIRDHQWVDPAEALRRRDAGEIELSPPTWITLSQLAAFDSVAEAVDTVAAWEPEFFATRIAVVGDALVALYHGDAGYDRTDASVPGPRHRLWMTNDGWRYERST